MYHITTTAEDTITADIIVMDITIMADGVSIMDITTTADIDTIGADVIGQYPADTATIQAEANITDIDIVAEAIIAIIETIATITEVIIETIATITEAIVEAITDQPIVAVIEDNNSVFEISATFSSFWCLS